MNTIFRNGARLGARLAAGRLARLAVAFALALASLASGVAHAHEMSMAEMQVRETTPGEFIWQWGATEKRPASQDLTPVWPGGCRGDDNAVHCGEAGLRGELSVTGVGDRYSAALVKIFWLDGQSRVYTLTAGSPTVQLYGSADDRRGIAEVGWTYLVLGVTHILGGIDHLLFVIGLLFLVGFRRRLVLTITAFTVAHSLTLASAALGWLTLRSPPVEACIALSIVLVAAEALHDRGPNDRDTLARRWPALVAFAFGLVHGLGFAGALKDIGLPQSNLPTALFTFNVGVEAGQLMTVGVAWLLWRLASRWPMAARMRKPLLYAIGTVAAWWSLARIVAIAG